MSVTQHQLYLVGVLLTISVTLVTSIIIASMEIGRLLEAIERNKIEIFEIKKEVDDLPPDNYEKFVDESIEDLRADIKEIKQGQAADSHRLMDLRSDVFALKGMVKQHMENNKK